MDRVLTLHFIDGTKLQFDFPEQTPSAAARQFKVADFLASKHLVVEAEGSVLIFPVSSIKYIALSLPTVPKKGSTTLPRHAIHGARIRS
jgi:hypothetical protein